MFYCKVKSVSELSLISRWQLPLKVRCWGLKLQPQNLLMWQSFAKACAIKCGWFSQQGLETGPLFPVLKGEKSEGQSRSSTPSAQSPRPAADTSEPGPSTSAQDGTAGWVISQRTSAGFSFPFLFFAGFLFLFCCCFGHAVSPTAAFQVSWRNHVLLAVCWGVYHDPLISQELTLQSGRLRRCVQVFVCLRVTVHKTTIIVQVHQRQTL